jgi:hypothetical protein
LRFEIKLKKNAISKAGVFFSGANNRPASTIYLWNFFGARPDPKICRSEKDRGICPRSRNKYDDEITVEARK